MLILFSAIEITSEKVYLQFKMNNLFPPEGGANEPLTVSQLTAQIKGLLEKRFFSLSVTGEISNCRPASSGHLYFTLKDRDASLSAVMFRGRQSGLSFRPKEGQMVTVRGSISLYAPRGSYQIICESMQLAGEGQILAMLEERKRKLAAEGLFDSDRKKPIPPFASRIAVITSPTGAALRDILNVVKRRSSGVELKIFPAAVQGADAALMIADRMKQVNLWKSADVIILGRGGGAIEDLLPFSEEEVVRAVAESEIPVISAVGHEIDWALSDFAADLRAPTPSAAAELVTADSDAILQRLDSIRRNCHHAVREQIELNRSLLRQYSREEMQRIIKGRLDHMRLQLDGLGENRSHSLERAIESRRHRLGLLKQALNENSPDSYRERGLARILKSDGTPAGSIQGLSKGEMIRVEMVDGRATAEISEVQHD